MFKNLILIGILFSFQVKAKSCNTEIEILKHLEKFKPVCYADNTQRSAGYGSGSLCKKINATEKTFVTEGQAEEHLREVDFPSYYKQVESLGFFANKKQKCILTTLVYHKGYGVVRDSGLVKHFNDYVINKGSKVAKHNLRAKLFQLSCQKTKGKWHLVNGLYARQGIVFEMLLGNVDSLNDVEKYRTKYLANKQFKKVVAGYCQRKNKTIEQLIETL
jgi:hypothetical protein